MKSILKKKKNTKEFSGSYPKNYQKLKKQAYTQAMWNEK
jgi:hypothetical protein